MSGSHLCRPFPELVEPEPASLPYEIRDSRGQPLPSTGMVDLGRRVMWVPFETGARATSRHELGHVAFTPLHPARVRFDPRVLMAVEDARVNLALAGLGLPVVLDAEAHAHVALLLAQDAKANDGFALFMRTVASLGTSIESTLEGLLAERRDAIGGLVVGWMARARSRLEAARAGGRVAPYVVGVDLARELARALRALGLLDARLRAKSRFGIGCCVGEWADGEAVEGGRRVPWGERPVDGHAAVEPGRLEVKKAPLSVTLRPGSGGIGWRAATEGSVVRYLARWPVDGAVFRRRARRGGGTLLVDNSGSMAFAVADLDRLLLATPHGMRVALYSGSGEAGELRIVADGGRRAAAEHLGRFGSGNVVDLPALEWLARQPHPRLWLSDGAVTGIGDRGSQVLRERCAALCRRAHIRRVAKLDEVVARH